MDELKNKGFFKITVEEPHNGETYTWTLGWDADVWVWYQFFKKMLYTLGFHPGTIKEALPEEE